MNKNQEEKVKIMRDNLYNSIERLKTKDDCISFFENAIGYISSSDEWQKIYDWLQTLTYDELLQLILTTGIKEIKYEITTPDKKKDVDKKKLGEFLNNRILSGKNNYIRHSQVDNLKDKEKIQISTIMGNCISDYIRIDRNDDVELMKLWEDRLFTRDEFGQNKVLIPSDLFFSKTIPLPNIQLEIDEREMNNGTIAKAKIKIAEDYENIVDNLNFMESAIVGCIEADIKLSLSQSASVLMTIGVTKGIDYCGTYPRIDISGIKNDSARQKLLSLPYEFYNNNLFIPWMETWYGIQIALLHPVLKGAFHSPNKRKNPERKSNDNHRKQPVKYIKHYYLNHGEIKNALHEERKYNRKALLWWVIGHWRTNKNGTKTFIHGYWKGVLRTTKKLDEPRERIIEMSDKELENNKDE